ncbi:NUDIX hydrolase [Streptomyces sp. NBC_01450]|uniref:NUDIX hydrolase n=1 Tax=Streptomyces sp. NBC_01450 TaxID=2903871 RepID=UPI002E30B6E6|nr:NUDIX hydrolase [Streptomyces sp. NBC_01450]
MDAHLDRMRAHPDIAGRVLRLEYTSVSLNPQAKLFGRRSLLDQFDPGRGEDRPVLAAFEEELTCPWALYHVRRILPVSKAHPTRRGRPMRSVERVHVGSWQATPSATPRTLPPRALHGGVRNWVGREDARNSREHVEGRPVGEQPVLAMSVVVDHGRLLLICRAAPEADLVWALPGGTVEPGETAEQAAVRETLEETGLGVEAVRLLGERVHPDTGRLIAYVACTVRGGRARAASSREVSAIAWAAPGEIHRYVPRGLFPPVQAYLDGR